MAAGLLKKVHIETLGCQMNKSDAERIFAILAHFGYSAVDEACEADFLIINTCSIRALSEEKAFSRLGVWGRWKRKEKDKRLKIALCGCLAQHTEEDLLARFPYLDLVFGTQNIYELPDLLRRIDAGERVCAVREGVVAERDFGNDAESGLFERQAGVNAWLPIIEGCNNFCTYCIVPYTRGRERSRDFEKIIQEARDIVALGFKEVTLLGQNVDSYGKDLNGKWTLADLIREINKIEGEFRIRFTTSYPTDITDDLIDAVAKSEKVCKYFHIPMQSGNSEILKAMNRRYDREKYGEIVSKIRSKIPEVIVTSDFIVGFPGESEEQFLDTVSALEELGINYSNIAAYSPRPKTPAAKWIEKFVDEDEKARRFQILNDKVKEISLKNHKGCVGKTLEVLVDSEKIGKNGDKNLIGRTKCNKIVHIGAATGAKIGDFINLKITSASTWHLKGEL